MSASPKGPRGRADGNRDDTGRVRVLLVAARSLTCEAIGRHLRECPDLVLAGCCASVELAGARVDGDAVDIVLVDVSGYESGIVDNIRALRLRASGARIVPLGVNDSERAVALLEAGASGYVMERTPLSGLADTIRRIHEDKPPCSARVAARASKRYMELAAQCAEAGVPSRVPSLTGRQFQVLHGLVEGLSNKEIATALGIRPSTAKNHVQAVLRKFAANTRRQAVESAYVVGLVQNPFAATRDTDPLGDLPPMDPQ